MDRLALGLSLDPTLRGSLCVVARTHALRGRLDEFDRIMARVSAGASTPLVEEIMLETRVALWYSDSDRARQILDRIPSQGGLTPQGFPLAALFCRTLLGEDTERPLLAMREASLAMSLAPKFRCNIHQVAVELTSRSDSELALSHLEELGELPFIDVEWIELCPGLAPLRDSPRFESARKKVRARASSVWTQDAPSSSDLSR
jgi:hypothetical protein